MRGEGDMVEVSFTAAIAAFGDLSMPFHVALTRLELGEWLAAEGRRDDAATLLAEARETFERLRARPSLERVERSSRRSLRRRGDR
ncbi:MAG TPA: hypothetical protein VFZ96_08920 [Actinomycetota bacterium]|nr:hypothetical protein [Actinomycetota bacterium]